MRENRSLGVPTRSDTNRPVQSQKQARTLEFQFEEEEGLYYPCSENKGTNCEADLRLCFRVGKKSGFLMVRLISYLIFLLGKIQTILLSCTS